MIRTAIKLSGWALVCFFVFSGRAGALTLSDMLTRVRQNVRDSDATRQRYADSVVTNLLNEAQTQAVSTTWCLDKSTVIVVVSGSSHYSAPSDFLAPIQTIFTSPAGTRSDLELMTREKVYGLDADWETTSGSVSGYWFRNDSRQQTAQFITLFDRPNSTGTLTMQYYNTPTDLSISTDIPFDSYPHLYVFHPMLVYFATARLKQIESKTDEAESYLGLYNTMEQNLQDRFGRISTRSGAVKIARPEKQ